MANLVVIYDSCVLYSAPLRDLLMRLALTDIYQAKWTNDIHEEWIRSLLKNRPDLTEERLNKIKDKMNLHVRDCLVNDYSKLIINLTLPDPNDRHVLAAAIKANAQLIVTFNLSDFPSKFLNKYLVKAIHPDLFIIQLLNINPSLVIRTIQETRLSLKNPPKKVEEYLGILDQQLLKKTVAYLKDYKNLI